MLMNHLSSTHYCKKNSLPASLLLFLGLTLVVLPNLAFAEDYMRTGTYTGDGSASRSITGIGFQPDFLIIKTSEARHGVAKTSDMPDGYSKKLGDNKVLETTRIATLDSDGFTVGDHHEVNKLGDEFYWVAMKAVPGSIQVGQYVGDGSFYHAIPLSDLTPDAVLVIAAEAEFPIFRQGEMDLFKAYKLSGDGLESNSILYNDTNAFNVGSSTTVNGDGHDFYYIAWEGELETIETGSYTGNNTSPRTISGLSLNPEYMLIANEINELPVHRPSSLPGDSSLFFLNRIAQNNLINSMSDGQFEIGSDPAVNQNGTKYFWLSFANPPDQADLQIGMEVDNSTPLENEPLIFTLRVINNGPNPVTSVQVTDLLPAGFSYVSSAPSQGTYNDATGIWDIGAMAVTNEQTLTLTATTDPGTGGTTLTNNTHISSSSEADPDPSNDSDSVEVNVQATAGSDLHVTLVADDLLPDETDAFIYTVTVANNGPDDATGITLQDTWPAELTLDSAVASQGIFDSGSGVWTLGNLTSGSSQTLTMTATVTNGTAGQTLNHSVAIVSFDQTDPNNSNDSASLDVTVQTVDIQVSQVVDLVTPDEDVDIHFTVIVTNLGPGAATSVVIQDVLPAGLTFVSASPSQGSFSSTTGLWNLGDISSGQTQTLTLTAHTDLGTGGNSIVNVSSLSAMDQTDASAGNNSASTTINVAQPGDVDLSLTMGVDNGTPSIGENVTYTLTVVNPGPASVSGLGITDLLPAEVTYVNSFTNKGTYQDATGLWTVGDLDNGYQAVLNILATVNSAALGAPVVNSASISAVDQADPQPANNTASAQILVPNCDLQMSMIQDPLTPVVGQTITYTVKVFNDGPNLASGVTVADNLPAGLAYISGIADLGNYDDSSGLWTVGGLNSGLEATLVLEAEVETSAAGTAVQNTALVNSLDQSDPVSGNDIVSSTSTIPGSDLELTLIADQATALEGDQVTFTLTATNHGPDQTTGVSINQALPAGLTYVSATPSAGSYTAATGQWLVGPIADQDIVTLDVTASVDAGTTGQIINNPVLVSASDVADPDSSNNQTTVSIIIFGSSQPDENILWPTMGSGSEVWPGQSDLQQALQFSLVNRSTTADTLQSLTLSNLTTGEGTPSQMDAEWQPIQIIRRASDEDVRHSASFINGEAYFENLQWNIEAGDTLVITVFSGASLAARDDAHLSLGVMQAEDLELAQSYTLMGGWPLVNGQTLTVDGFVAAQAVVQRQNAELLSIGSQNNLAFTIDLPGNGYLDDSLYGITLKNYGSALPNDDISALSLWADEGDGIFDATTDTHLGEALFSGLYWQLSGLNFPVPADGYRFFATVNIAETAQPSRDIRLGLPITNGYAVEMFSGNDGPVDEELESPVTLGISVTDRVILTAEWFVSGMTLPGANNLPLLQFVLTNTYETPRQLESLSFMHTTLASGADQDQLDAICQQVNLYLDTNNNGELEDPTVDQLLGTGVFENSRVTFYGLNQELLADSGPRLFVTADLGLNTVPDGTLISGEIENLFDINIPNSTVVANWPVQSGIEWETNGIIAEQIISHPISVLTLGPGEGPVLALDLTLPANGFLADELVGVTFTNEGSAVASDLQDAELWSDGGDGVFNAGGGDDILLGDFTVAGSTWFSTILSHEIPVGGSRLFASLTVADSPSDSVIVQLGVPLNGITVSSANDGPIDESLAGQSSLVISTSPLRSSLAFESTESNTGQTQTVTMTVRNAGSETVTGIEPYLGVSSGESLLELTVPTPAIIGSLDPAQTAQFSWSFESILAGEVVLEGNAQGLVNLDQVRRSIVTPTAAHTIYNPVPNLELYPTANLPFSINRGQQDLVPLTLTFVNPGDENGANAHLTGMRIRLMESAEGNDIVPADLLDQIVISEGTDVYLATTDLPTTGGIIDLEFTHPVVITESEPVTVGLRLDLKLNSVVPSFLISIEESIWISGNDAINDNNLTVVYEDGSFPLRTGQATLVSQATGLNVAVNDLAPGSSVPGQDDVLIAEIILSQTLANDTSSSIDVGSLAFRFHDEEGVPLVDPSSIFSNLSLLSAFQEHYTGTPVTEADSIVVLSLSAPVTISGESSLVLRLMGDISPDAALGTVTPLLASPDYFDARDGNMNNPVPVAWATDPAAPELSIVGPASILQVAGISTLPQQVSIGTRDLDALTLTLSHPGEDNTAPISCDTLVVSFVDATRQPQNPAPFLDRIRVMQTDTVLGFAIDPNSENGRIVLPLTEVQLEPGQSLDLQVKLDVRSDSAEGHLELVCHEDGFIASDVYSGTSLIIEAASGGSLPLSSGLTQVVEVADELRVAANSLMPALLAPQEQGTSVLALSLYNPASEGGGGIQINSLTLGTAPNKADEPTLDEYLDTIVLRRGETDLASVSNLESGANTVVLEPVPNLIIDAGATLEMVVVIYLREDAPEGSLKLILEESGLAAGPPGGGGFSIQVLPTSGYTFPMATESGNVGSASLEASYANYPNPFAAGSEPTTFAYSLVREATVDLRIMTPHGELVATILKDEPRSAGLHQSDLWLGLNGNGSTVHNGVYLAELVVHYSDGEHKRLLRKVGVVR